MSDFDAKGGGFSRRAVTIGGGIATALGLAALGMTAPSLFGKRYTKTPYDDLLALLTDRDTAVRVGEAKYKELAAMSGLIDFYPKAPQLAKQIRERLRGRGLAEVTQADITEGKLTEVEGWVLPTTLTNLCLLAAMVEH